MGQYGMVLGFVGLAFSAVDCFAETLRGMIASPACSGRHMYVGPIRHTAQVVHLQLDLTVMRPCLMLGATPACAELP